MAELLANNQHKLSKWLNDVAEGSPAFGRDPDTAKALDLLWKLAEFAAPKLGRVEHVGDDGGPLRAITTIEIEFVDAPPRPITLENGKPLNGHASHPGLTLDADSAAP